MGRVQKRVAQIALAAGVTAFVQAGDLGRLTLKASDPVVNAKVESLNSPEMNRMQNHAILRMGSQIRNLNARVRDLERELARLRAAEGKHGAWSAPAAPFAKRVKARLENATGKEAYVVRTYGANVRTGPSMKYPILRQHRRGDIVLTDGFENGWLKVSNGGWISARIVEPLEKAAELIAASGKAHDATDAKR